MPRARVELEERHRVPPSADFAARMPWSAPTFVTAIVRGWCLVPSSPLTAHRATEAGIRTSRLEGRAAPFAGLPPPAVDRVQLPRTRPGDRVVDAAAPLQRDEQRAS